MRDDDKAVFCEGECQSWYHVQCLDIDDVQYAHLNDSEEKWECPACQNSDLPPLHGYSTVSINKKGTKTPKDGPIKGASSSVHRNIQFA